MKKLRDFSIVKEDWGRYSLPNGVLLVARVTLTQLVEETGQPLRTGVKTAIQVDSWVPEALRGPPNKESLKYGSETVILKYSSDMIVEERPAESLYMDVNGTTLRFRMHPKEARMHSVRNQWGDPVVELDSISDLTVVAPPTIGLARELVRKATPREASARKR